MSDDLEKIKLADKKRAEIAKRIKARLDRQRRQELERIRMMNAFAIVSSLGMMTVIDFLLAYWGGDWLDNYFQTADHFWRKICLGIAGLTFFLAIFKLIYFKPLDEKPTEDGNEQKDENTSVDNSTKDSK